jgi:uncharacterized protein
MMPEACTPQRYNVAMSRQLRWILAGAALIASAGLLWILLGAANSALSLWRELDRLPPAIAIAIGLVFVAFVGASGWIAWRVTHPRPRRARSVPAPTRDAVVRRVESLQALGDDTAQFQRELEELDRRRASEACYVAVFGEISAGKSSLIRALAPEAATDIDVLGGTTTRVGHFVGRLDAGRELVLADVPGTQESGGSEREQVARDEALRAHAVIYVAAGDLTRAQDAELRWLHGYAKPLVLTLNKRDQWSADERDLLLAALRRRYDDVVDAIVAVSAGGTERFERPLADGRREQVSRERTAQIDDLRTALTRLTASTAALEPAREQAVLGATADKLAQRERDVAARRSQEVVDRYTRRAVVGALAAVAPGSDLLIQGALATGLIRELAALHQVPIRQFDLDAFLQQAAMTLRTTASIVLAIAGNALKAFPGLGTLGGGVMHAIAYGLIFDSLGHAVAATLAEQRAFDAVHAAEELRRALGEHNLDRLRRVAETALRAAREPLAPE